MITMAVYDWLNDHAQLSHSIATVKPFHSSSWSHRFPTQNPAVYVYLSWDLRISLFERLFEMWLVRVMTTFFLRLLLLPALSSLEISHVHVFSEYFNADADYVVAQAP